MRNVIDKFREIVYSVRKYKRTHILKDTKDKARACTLKLSVSFRMCFLLSVLKEKV